MAKKVFTKEIIEENVRCFTSEDKEERKLFTKTNMTTEWMDAYVAKIQPDTIEEWIAKCLSMPEVQSGNRVDKNGKKIMIKPTQAIREYFISRYFPDFTEEAIEAKKKEAREKLEAEKAKKERFKALTPEEQFREKMKSLMNEE